MDWYLNTSYNRFLTVLHRSNLWYVCRLCWRASGHPPIREVAFDGPSFATLYWPWHISDNQSNTGKRATLLAQNKVCVLRTLKCTVAVPTRKILIIGCVAGNSICTLHPHSTLTRQASWSGLSESSSHESLTGPITKSNSLSSMRPDSKCTCTRSLL